MFLTQLRSRITGAVVLPLAGVLLLGACQDAVMSSRGAPPADYDGVTLFRGIMLADGPVAGLVPGIDREMRLDALVADEQQLAEVRDTHRRMIASIQADHPRFFVEFEQAMESGDHNRISQALQGAAEITVQAALKLDSSVQSVRENRATIMEAFVQRLQATGQDTPENRARAASVLDAIVAGNGDLAPLLSGTDQQLGFALAVVSILHVAIAAVLVVAAAVVFAVAKYVTVGDQEQLSRIPAGDVLYDQIVHSIATTLRA